MPLSQEYADYILDLLEPLGKLTLQKMFGGAVIKSDSVQVGVIIENQFYFKTGEDQRDKFKKHGSKPFTYKKKGEWITIHAWYLAPEEIIDDPSLFLGWAEEALAWQKS